MQPESKAYFARLSFGLGVMGLIMGSILACDCWGWFVCAGAFFIYPIKHGSRLLRIFSVILLLLSIFTAVVQFRADGDLEKLIHRLRAGHKTGDKLPGLTDLPHGSKVIIKDSLREFEMELPEQLRRQFVAMLQGEATYVDFSMLSAAPFAEVTVGGHVLYWHGNAVAEGTKGRVWTSPVMQALINRFYERPETIEGWTRALDELNTDTNISSTVIQGLGAYPVR